MLEVTSSQLMHIRTLQVKLLMAIVVLEEWLDDLDNYYGELPDEYMQQLPDTESIVPLRMDRRTQEYGYVEVVHAGLSVKLSPAIRRASPYN